MSLEYHNFYHPFKKNFFGFLTNEDRTNISGFSVSNVDLYYQPLEHPAVAFTVFFIKLLVIVIGEVVSMQVLTMMKKETSIIDGLIYLFTF